MSGPGFPPPGQPPAGPHWPGPQGNSPDYQQPGAPQPWASGPPPAPGGGGRRWLLLALAFLAVIAVSVAATVWFTHRGSGGQAGSAGGSSQASDGGIASAGDTGPVGIITEDPTCDRWVAMQNDVAAKLADWGKRDASVPASSWTPEQHQMYESAARVLRAQAEQVVSLARETPHRVMRELYEQRIAYNRAYADAIADYDSAKDQLALVGNDIAATLINVCFSIKNYSAADRAESVSPVDGPTLVAPVGNPADPKRFMTGPSAACPAIKSLSDRENLELEAWFKTDPDVPVEQRGSADKVLWEMASGVLRRGSDELERIGRSSGNGVVEDFLVLSAQYYRAFVNAIPTSTGADTKLYSAAQKAQVSVYSACNIAQG